MALTAKAVKQVHGWGMWGMCQTHSPGGATAAEFFVGVSFRDLIRKNKYITIVINVILFSLKLTKQY